MHSKSEVELKELAANEIEKANGDLESARENFREEARARWSPDDDGLRAAYLTKADEIFVEAERLDHNQQHALERYGDPGTGTVCLDDVHEDCKFSTDAQGNVTVQHGRSKR